MIKKTMISLFFVVVIAMSVSVVFEGGYGKAQARNKRVLILNSYHRGLEWTDSINEIILEGFSEDIGKYDVFIEYMDWKNSPQEANLEILTQLYSYKYKDKQIDLIITTDDIALSYAIKYRKLFFSDAPIIFTGVNVQSAQTLTEGVDNITGVLEQVDIENTLLLVKKTYPEIENIYVLFDDSESGIAMGEETIYEIEKFDSNLNTIPRTEKGIEEIINRINTLPRNSAVFITVFYNDTYRSIEGFSANARYIAENTINIPIFTLYDFNMGFGVLGGSMLSSELSGNIVLDISNKVLSGKDINSIPFVRDAFYERAVDYQAMQKLGLSKENISPDFRIINKPPSLMESYGDLVYTALVIGLLLIAIVIILCYHIKKLVYYKNILERKNNEQRELYDNLCISEEELKAQYEELIDTNDQLQNMQNELTYLAYHDTLTGLGNRAGFLRYFNDYLSVENGLAAIIMTDIDNFKHINDSMGHVFGDHLIKEVAGRMEEMLHSTSSVFRVGGDEFAIFLVDCEQKKAEAIASKIIAEFTKPFEIDGKAYTVSLSMGIALYPRDGVTSNELMTKADIAMYQSKEGGKGRATSFTIDMLENINKRRKIEASLQAAQKNGEFTVHYQPQLSIKDHSIWGFEALLRWNSAELGYVPPIDFIGIAEENQFIVPIGYFVLDEACRFIKEISEKDQKNYCIAINISPVQIVDKNFVDNIIETVERYQIPYSSLEIEITESVMMQSFDMIYQKLIILREKGIRIALDDFGTGYSSLNYIKRLPLTTLKIDKSFISDIEESSSQSNLISAIIDIGNRLNLEVVAEGVETKDQFHYLIERGADRIQGYYYSKPVSQEGADRFTKN